MGKKHFEKTKMKNDPEKRQEKIPIQSLCLPWRAARAGKTGRKWLYTLLMVVK